MIVSYSNYRPGTCFDRRESFKKVLLVRHVFDAPESAKNAKALSGFEELDKTKA
jgi:hypothetical protein